MIIYRQKEINLEDAMTMNIQQADNVVWHVDGLYIKVRGLSRKAKNFVTSVSKENGKYKVQLAHGFSGNLNSRVMVTDVFEHLEELRKKYPKLFELKGAITASCSNLTGN